MQNQALYAIGQLGCGTTSEALGARCFYPLQFITSRLETQHFNANAAYSTMLDVLIKTTFQHEPLRNCQGLLPNLLKVVPTRAPTKLKVAIVMVAACLLGDPIV